MRRSIAAMILGGLLDWYGPATAQSFEDVDHLWHQTMAALGALARIRPPRALTLGPLGSD